VKLIIKKAGEMELPVNYDELSIPQKRIVREQYIKEQNGKCCHCGQPFDRPPCSSVRSLPVNKKLFPIGFFKHPVHLHHSHETGMTIGAVHNYCNAVLWQYHGE
jgi:hypothetical protein